MELPTPRLMRFGVGFPRLLRYDQPTCAPPLSQKRAGGQFFTVGNPFVLDAFRAWFEAIPFLKDPSTVVLEPFAGANNLVKLMREAGYDRAWACYDIDPPAPQAEGFPIHTQDTLAHYPQGFHIAITNPPYLARNSAVRRGLDYPQTPYDDLYKHALGIALDHTPYVAAIIPESFITSGLFHERLYSAPPCRIMGR